MLWESGTRNSSALNDEGETEAAAKWEKRTECIAQRDSIYKIVSKFIKKYPYRRTGQISSPSHAVAPLVFFLLRPLPSPLLSSFPFEADATGATTKINEQSLHEYRTRLKRGPRTKVV